MRRGQWISSSDGQRWYFDPGNLALDFAYTGDFGTGHPEWEQLHEPNDLDAWIRERFGEVNAANPTELADALALRSALWVLVTARADGQSMHSWAIDDVNRAAATAPVRPFLPGGSYPAPTAAISNALATIAEEGITLLKCDGDRVRRCAAPDCQLIFIDLSRPNARRWCSMSRCGNRSKLRNRRTSHAKASSTTWKE